jgi:hypothetical protein
MGPRRHSGIKEIGIERFGFIQSNSVFVYFYIWRVLDSSNNSNSSTSSPTLLVVIGCQCIATMASTSMNNMSSLACMFMLMASYAAFMVIDEEEEEEVEDASICVPVTAIVKAMPCLRRLRKRLLMDPDEAPQRKKPRLFDYQRAKLCIAQDYLGPDPFFGHYFERVFRVTRGIVEKLIQVDGSSSSFFTQQQNKVTGKEGICPEAKVLIALKQLAFGVSGVAFTDYFQMSDTTA